MDRKRTAIKKKQDRANFAMNYTLLQDPAKWVIL